MIQSFIVPPVVGHGQRKNQLIFDSMSITGFQMDGQKIAKAQVEVLGELTRAVKEVAKELKVLNDREESKIKY
jgi:hypothetical protein